MSAPEVIVVGSCNTDLIAYVPRLPAPGETLLGTDFKQGFGGKGANQCCMSAKMGAVTAMVGKVGTDGFGTQTFENFKNLGVDTTYLLSTNDAPTGVAPIAVDGKGENCIIVVPGANMLLTPADVNAAMPMINGAKVVVCQNEIDLGTTLEALKLAARCPGTRSIFNPAPAPASLDSDFFLLPDIFCVNETEAHLLTGVSAEDEGGAKAAARALIAMGAQTAVVTLGSAGTMLAQGGSEPVLIPTTTVKVVDTSGAGDSFIGALAFFMACSTLPLTEAIRRANSVAAVSVQGTGTQSSYPERSMLPAALFEGL